MIRVDDPHRAPKQVIGTRGYESMLTELGLWRDGMRRAEAQQLMWDSEPVRAQLTILEKLYRDNGIILLYEPKAHPIFSAIEARIPPALPFWSKITRTMLQIVSL